QSVDHDKSRPPNSPILSKGPSPADGRSSERSIDIDFYMGLSCTRTKTPCIDIVNVNRAVHDIEFCVKMLQVISSLVAIMHDLFEQNVAREWYLFPYLSKRADVCGSLLSIKRHDGNVGFAGEVILESRRDQVHPCRVDVERRRAFKIVFHEYCVKCSIHPEAPKWSDVSR